MKRNLLLKIFLFTPSFFLSVALLAQNQAANSKLFDYTFADGEAFPAFGNKILKKAAYTLSFSGLKGADANRSKTIDGVLYTGACRTQQLEVSGFSSIGEISFAIQNGSGKSDGYLLCYVADGTDNWTLADSLFVPKGKSLQYSPSSVITKSAAKIRLFFSDGPTFWLYGIKAYSYKNETLANTAPELLNIQPSATAFLPINGSVTLRFDELMKRGAGKISLSDAFIESVVCKGNLVQINYRGYTDDKQPLIVEPNALTNFSGKPLAAQISSMYAIDVHAPVFESSNVIDGSSIHINDLGKEERKIKLIFNEEIKIGKGSATFGSAKLKASVQARELTLSYSGLPYNSEPSLIIPATYVTDLSNNPLENDLKFNFKTRARDNTAPNLVAQSISSGASSQPVGGSISFEFDEMVLAGSVHAKINGEDAILSSNGKYIGLNYMNLPHNSVVTVDLPQASVTDTCGNVFPGLSFKFSTASNAPRIFDVIVDKSGNGNFTSIQAAINSITDASKRTLIFVRRGIYQEKLVIPAGKNNISLIGENVDNTVITWNECSSTATPAPGTDNSFTMQVAGDDFYAENLTIRNDYDYTHRVDANKQAVALMNRGDKQVFKNCKFISYQDTHYLKDENKRQYFANCMIQGNIDFIFGSGTAFFESCAIKCIDRASYITAASTTPQEFGFVFKNCTIEAAQAKFSNSFYLGRPWGQDCKTVFLDTKMQAGLIQPKGWSEWNGTINHLSAFYAEYNSMNMDGSAIDLTKRVAWAKQLTDLEAARYNQDNAFNFASAGSWNPLPMLAAPIIPASPSLSFSGEFTWQAVSYASGYAVYKNGSLLTTVTTPIYKVEQVNPSDMYSVAAYSEYGALSPRSPCAQAGIEHLIAKMDVLQKNMVEEEILLKNPDFYATIEVVNLKGQRLIHKEIHGVSVFVGNLPKGTYYARACTKLNECRVETFVKK